MLTTQQQQVKKKWDQWQQNQWNNNSGCRGSSISSLRLSPPLTQRMGVQQLENVSNSTLRSKYNVSSNKTINQIVEKNPACTALVIKGGYIGKWALTLYCCEPWLFSVVAGQRSVFWHVADVHKHRVNHMPKYLSTVQLFKSKVSKLFTTKL